MGKKKTQKTKQISVAIAETSTSKLPDDGGAHGGGQSVQPRKRGRPRKVLDEPPDDKKLPPPPADVADKPLQKKGNPPEMSRRIPWKELRSNMNRKNPNQEMDREAEEGGRTNPEKVANGAIDLMGFSNIGFEFC
ncbi:hypothetical protein SDJN03_18336, partial [Cucurbita argyrosperma subsp. sororia]